MYVEYSSNNSGGRWWLADEDWKALEAAGWKVRWAHLVNVFDKEGQYVYDEDGTPKLMHIEKTKDRFQKTFVTKYDDGTYRYMGALASHAYRAGLHLREAADEWERATDKSSTDAGCACCGQPHDFTEYDDNGKWVDSGPSISYEASW